METHVYTTTSLKKFINSSFYKKLENVPISKHRALSQINNPRAKKDDVILVAQYDENKTVGYLGVLPDYFKLNNSEDRIGWLTCFWVDENYRNKGVAANLFIRVMRAWKKKLFITNIAPNLEPVYQKTKLFYPTKFKMGFRGYLQFNLTYILINKKPTLTKFSWLLKGFDISANTITKFRFNFFSFKALDKLTFEYHSDFNNVDQKIITKSFEENFNKRTIEDLNWIIKNPWVLSGDVNDPQNTKYYFSSINKHFEYQIITFKCKETKDEALALILINNKKLSIPYFFSKNENLTNLIVLFLIKKMIGSNLEMVTTFHPLLMKGFIKEKSYFVFSKSISKPYFISKQVENITDLNFQDGDGDCAFY